MANTRSRHHRHTLAEIPVHQVLDDDDLFGNVLNPLPLDSPLNNIQIPLSYLSPPQMSPDEQLIQARGRKKICWSPGHDPRPLTSPLKTPTKKLSAMQLRSSPRKRLISEFVEGATTPEKSSALYSPHSQTTPSFKKIRFDDEAATSRLNPDIPLSRLLTGLSRDQLINVILRTVRREPHIEDDIRLILPSPDLKPLEERLNQLKRNISRSLPKTRLVSKTDSASHTRAAPHLDAFKRCLFEQLKILADSSHWDALLDFVPIAWNYVKATPIWDNAGHNTSGRKACFKQLAASAKTALKNGGVYLGEKRLKQFAQRIKTMSIDNDEIKVLEKDVEDLLSE